MTAPAPPPDVQQDEQASASHQKGVQAGAPPIPRAFCDEILTVLSNLPEEWPLVKIDLLLNKAETYYVSWRRFLYLNERLRTLDKATAARTISRNKDRILEHLVQVLSKWKVASIEPAKDLTRTKEPEFMFLHTKDFWFRSIWIDLHQALTIDCFFCCERLSASMARSLHLSFICIPQSTRALDQGGVEPRQAVSPKALRPWTIPLRYSVG